MNGIVVVMACGCSSRPLGSGGGETPYCQTHDEHRVQSVKAPPPRIRAVNCEASGPHVVKER
jgi:hypothetical protein